MRHPFTRLSAALPSAFNYYSEAICGQTEVMSAQPQQACPRSETELAAMPIGLRLLAILLRTVFFGALIAITVRLSSPQSETIWSVYETPGDLIRLALGFAVCLWIVIHFFMFPKKTDIYRAWIYLGLVVAPLALAIAIVIWR
jgi:hypothetical protein